MSRTGTAGFLLVVLLFGGSVIAEELKGPRISVAEARRDLGTVEQGAHPEHVFAISNTGDADLEIRHIQTG